MNFPLGNLSLFLDEISRQVWKILEASEFITQLPAGLIKDRILDYSSRGGKCLRPGLLCAATGAVGGLPEEAIHVAVAVEMFHTWTLVHDDIIDRDTFRRGGLTMHAKIKEDFQEQPDIKLPIPLDHFSHSMALLIGDAQHGMVLDMLARSFKKVNTTPDLILDLILQLEGSVLPALLTGEVMDVMQTTEPLENILPDEIELMLQRKTGALLTFSVVAGGMLGLKTTNKDHPFIRALKAYGENLGLAFQLRDDILGILGDQKKLGKPIGSDFREGKRTLAIKLAFDHSTSKERKTIKSLLGKKDLKPDEIERLRTLVIKNGGIEKVTNRSTELIDRALNAISQLPNSECRHILESVANFTISRNS